MPRYNVVNSLGHVLSSGGSCKSDFCYKTAKKHAKDMNARPSNLGIWRLVECQTAHSKTYPIKLNGGEVIQLTGRVFKHTVGGETHRYLLSSHDLNKDARQFQVHHLTSGKLVTYLNRGGLTTVAYAKAIIDSLVFRCGTEKFNYAINRG